ncbi:MAG: basic amino acid/polyamine antiporter, APA family [Bacteroidetes bacterium]|nr:MAG: basic amino acid/polyamine antiporter, APA family [Bacteroidota bacterium]
MSLFRKKSLESLLAQASDSEKGLKRTLGAGNLVALGIGAIIGAGLFVRTAAASAEASGSAVTLSFLVAAIGCAFAGLCYAEFASMIPIAGSAYAYTYVTMGELVAWIIGWALIMEYALGAATVSIAWSEYLNNLLGGSIPYEWCHSPFEGLYKVTGDAVTQVSSFLPEAAKSVKEGVLLLTEEQYAKLPANLSSLVDVTHGFLNAPALLILLLITLLLIKGSQESAIVNAIIVFVKVAIVLLFIGIGWQFINPANHTPYMIPEDYPGHEGIFKHGWGGILGGAAIVFFAFIGFDAVSTAAQEAKNPKRDMPIGILGSLVVCTILYVLFGHVLTGVANWTEFKTAGKEASVAYAIEHYMPGYHWLATAVTVAILAGFSSVILVMLMGQSRVFYTMSNDGLIPKAFGVLHPKFKTPYKANMILFVFVGLFAAFVPGSVAGDLTSFGTLFAFVLVSAGVWIMRVKSPNIERPFKTPIYPVVSFLGVAICTAMIAALDLETLKVAGIWMALGLVIYFLYSKRNSKLNNNK